MHTDFEIGDKVNCKKFGALTHDFIGQIEKIYENSAMVSILDHHADDSVAVSDFHKRAVVRLKNMKKVTA